MKEELLKELELLKNESAPTADQTKRIKDIEKELKKLADEEAQTTEKKPVITELVGTISSVSDVLVKDGRPFRMVGILSKTDETVRPVAEKFFQRNLARFQEDMIVHLAIESRVAGKTTYVDRETGELRKHTVTGESITSIRKATSREMSLLYRDEDFGWASAKLESVDDSKAVAYATLLGSILK